MRPTEWHDYQKQAADVFANLGCLASVDAKLNGVRAPHRIDVLVQFARWGVPQIWIVECKHQRRRVTKSAVEALKSIVLDTGAEKGFLLSEIGFQPAAVSAARLTNVSLLSLAELEVGAAPDVREYLLARLETQTLSLMKLLKGLQVEVERTRNGAVYGVKPGVDYRGAIGGVGSLVCLVSALQGAKIGEFVNAVPRAFPKDMKRSVALPDADAVLSEGFRLHGEVSVWLNQQEERIQRAARRMAVKQLLKAATPPQQS